MFKKWFSYDFGKTIAVRLNKFGTLKKSTPKSDKTGSRGFPESSETCNVSFIPMDAAPHAVPAEKIR